MTFFRRPAPSTDFDPDPATKLQYAVAFLSNHVTFFGPPESASDEDWKSSQVQRMDHVPADVQVALQKAAVAAAQFIEQVFIEGL